MLRQLQEQNAFKMWQKLVTGFVIRDFMKILLTTISSKIPIFDADDAGLAKFYCICCCWFFTAVALFMTMLNCELIER